jgi:hypothetical protein
MVDKWKDVRDGVAPIFSAIFPASIPLGPALTKVLRICKRVPLDSARKELVARASSIFQQSLNYKMPFPIYNSTMIEMKDNSNDPQ